MIETPEFSLHFDVTDRTAEGDGGLYLEWLHLRVDVRVPGFTGKVEWSVMPSELLAFRDALAEMNELVSGASAELKGTEPGVALRLTAATGGCIKGEFLVSDRYRNPESAVLQGTFSLDQSYLPEISAAVDTLLACPARRVGE